MRGGMFHELDREVLREGLGILTSSFGRSELPADTQDVWLRRLRAHGVQVVHFKAAVDKCVDVEPRFPVLSVVLSRCLEARRAREQRLRDDSRRLMGILKRDAPALHDTIALELHGEKTAQEIAHDLNVVGDVQLDQIARLGERLDIDPLRELNLKPATVES